MLALEAPTERGCSMFSRQSLVAGLLGLVASFPLVGCAADVGDTEDEVEDTYFDDKADRQGLVEHDSSLQDIREVGLKFDGRMRAHAYQFKLGTDEHVSLYTQLFSGDRGPELDTVLYLYQLQDNHWGHYIRKNNNTAGTKWSRIELDLEPGEYRVIASAATRSVNGDFGLNMACEDGRCERYAPQNNDPEVTEVGEADEPLSGTVSFVVPLENDDGVLLSSFNDALRAAGLETFPDNVTISSSSNNPTARWDMYNERAAQEAVVAITGSDMMQYQDPGAFAANGFCYRGNGSALANFTQGFSDNIFSDMYSVYGWRAGELSAYNEAKEPTEANNDYADWSDYDATGDDVMIMYSTDDDGTAQFTNVPRCN